MPYFVGYNTKIIGKRYNVLVDIKWKIKGYIILISISFERNVNWLYNKKNWSLPTTKEKLGIAVAKITGDDVISLTDFWKNSNIKEICSRK